MGRAVLEALRGLDADAAAELEPVLGKQLTDLLLAAADPDQWGFGLFLFQIQ